MSLVPYRPSLRPRALRPHLKRDPLGCAKRSATMPSIALTPFQVRAEKLISTILHDAGLSVTSRDIRQFEAPFYNPGAPLPVLHLQGPAVEFWIHDDELGFRVRKTDYFTEAQAHRDVDAQLDHAGEALRRALAGGAA